MAAARSPSSGAATQSNRRSRRRSHRNGAQRLRSLEASCPRFYEPTRSMAERRPAAAPGTLNASRCDAGACKHEATRLHGDAASQRHGARRRGEGSGFAPGTLCASPADTDAGTDARRDLMIQDERTPDEAGRSPLVSFSPMALYGATTGELIGRPSELTAIDQEIASTCTGRLVGVTLEGEPGIGKTRLLLAARERAERAGMTVIAVAADEELRGPFLVARSIMASPEAIEVASDSLANDPLRRCLSAMSGEDDPSLASLPADQRLLRTLDLGAVAFRALAGDHGLAVLIDDVQWADDDSLRLLRYVVRANATSPILLLFAIRPEEFALVTEAVN